MQVKQRKRIKIKIRKELDKESDMTEAEEMYIFDIWHLSMADRWRLYRYVSSFFTLITLPITLKRKVGDAERICLIIWENMCIFDI